jgi:hypothetical protein
MEWLDGPHHPADIAQFQLLVDHPAVQAELTYYKVYPTGYRVNEQEHNNGHWCKVIQIKANCDGGDYPKLGKLVINSNDYKYLMILRNPQSGKRTTVHNIRVPPSTGHDPLQFDWPSITNGAVMQTLGEYNRLTQTQPILVNMVTIHKQDGSSTVACLAPYSRSHSQSYNPSEPLHGEGTTYKPHYANGKWEEYAVEARPIYAKMLDLIHNLYQEYRDSMLDQ